MSPTRRLIRKHASARAKAPRPSVEVAILGVGLCALAIAGGWLLTIRPSFRVLMNAPGDHLFDLVRSRTHDLRSEFHQHLDRFRTDRSSPVTSSSL